MSENWANLETRGYSTLVSFLNYNEGFFGSKGLFIGVESLVSDYFSTDFDGGPWALALVARRYKRLVNIISPRYSTVGITYFTYTILVFPM